MMVRLFVVSLWCGACVVCVYGCGCVWFMWCKILLFSLRGFNEYFKIRFKLCVIVFITTVQLCMMIYNAVVCMTELN